MATWERAVLEAVRGLRYGSVEVLVHEGQVVQLETRGGAAPGLDRPAENALFVRTQVSF